MGRGKPGPAVLEEHDKLSFVDDLGLSNDATHVRLETLLLNPTKEHVLALAEYICPRLDQTSFSEPSNKSNMVRASDSDKGNFHQRYPIATRAAVRAVLYLDTARLKHEEVEGG